MVVPHHPEDLCRRIESSVQRIVDVRNLACDQEGGKIILRGEVDSRQDVVMCIAVALSVPGADAVVSEIKISH